MYENGLYIGIALGVLLLAAIVAVFCAFCVCRGGFRSFSRQKSDLHCPLHSPTQRQSECPLINYHSTPTIESLYECFQRSYSVNDANKSLKPCDPEVVYFGMTKHRDDGVTYEYEPLRNEPTTSPGLTETHHQTDFTSAWTDQT